MITHFENQHFKIYSGHSVTEINQILDEKLYYVFPQIFKEHILEELKKVASDSNKFKDFQYENSLMREQVVENKDVLKVHFLMNNQELFRFIEQFVPERINHYHGRIFKIKKGNYSLRWHKDDRVPGRKIAMSVNLSAPRKDDSISPDETGGSFHIRKIGKPETEQVFHNHVFGQTVIFRVLPETLEHKVESVHDEYHRIAMAGWFSAVEED